MSVKRAAWLGYGREREDESDEEPLLGGASSEEEGGRSGSKRQKGKGKANEETAADIYTSDGLPIHNSWCRHSDEDEAWVDHLEALDGLREKVWPILADKKNGFRYSNLEGPYKLFVEQLNGSGVAGFEVKNGVRQHRTLASSKPLAEKSQRMYLLSEDCPACDRPSLITHFEDTDGDVVFWHRDE